MHRMLNATVPFYQVILVPRHSVSVRQKLLLLRSSFVNVLISCLESVIL